MKRFTACFLFYAAALCLLAPQHNYAQSKTSPGPARPDQEQVIRELLGEVRQLRIALQRMSVNSYRAQVMVERLRLQQGQVTRLTQELNGIRSQISEMKAVQLNLKEKAEEVEKKKDQGVIPDSEVMAVKAAVTEFKQREQSLAERETQLMIELNVERANLEDMNRRLDALERELVMTVAGEEVKPKKQ